MTTKRKAELELAMERSGKAWKWIRRGIVGSLAAQVAGVVAVYAIDARRKRRSPGGFKGFSSARSDTTVVDGNQIKTYTRGTELYADQIAAINNAKEMVYFETYVWRSDRIGWMFKDALYAAAERGVKVFVIYDGFGSLKSSVKFKHFKNHPNMYVHRLAEIRKGTATANPRATGRNHRKLLLVDDKIGFVGGFNVGVDFGTEWRDTHIRIIGPAVRPLSLAFRQFWNLFRAKNQPELPDWEELPWSGSITPAFNLPSSLLFPVRGQYLEAFEKATQSIDLTTAYFIPDRDILHALIRATKRGVRVRILVPEYSNHILADWVARPFFGELMEADVEIWLYQHAMIHAKTLVIDNYRSIVGTANIDRLSMSGNFEVTVQIDSENFGEQMERIFERDLETSRKLNLKEWNGRSRWVRFLERLVSRFSFIV
ncbi:phospholipase D-like domain-containing protein [Actinomycetaceae bacterium MB13-C1-2]|nr:phospholipase D-like domain-containing protein [Actinomycetaceae bacterium MB13-C1-2]